MEKTAKVANTTLAINNITAIVKNGIVTLFFCTLITITVLGVLNYRSIMNNAAERKFKNADILNNLAAMAHVDYEEENKMIVSEIKDMSAMIFAERHIKISRNKNLTAGSVTVLKDEEYVSMRFYAAQDYTLDLDISIDRNNNTILVSYPSDIFILSYDFDDHVIDKNTGQEIVDVGRSVVDNLKDCVNFYSEYYTGNTVFDIDESDPLIEMLEIVKISQGIEMEAKWKEKTKSALKENYGNFDVKFKNTKPIELTAEQQLKLNELIIENE